MLSALKFLRYKKLCLKTSRHGDLQLSVEHVVRSAIYTVWRNRPTRNLAASLLRFLGHTHTHTHTHGRTPLNKWSAHKRDRYLHNTQQRQELNIPVLRGIRTRIPARVQHCNPYTHSCLKRDSKLELDLLFGHPGYQVPSCSQYVLPCVVLEIAGAAKRGGGGEGREAQNVPSWWANIEVEALRIEIMRRPWKGELPTVSQAFELPITYRIL
jgi:hypothetical protein